MKHQEDLCDTCEDAVFALFMENHKSDFTEEYMKWNETLKDDPNAQIPQDICKQDLRTIRNDFRSTGKKEKAHAAKIAILACCFSFILLAAFANGWF